MLTPYEKHIMLCLRDGADVQEHCTEMSASDIADITDDLIVRGYIEVTDFDTLELDTVTLALTEKGNKAIG